MQGPISLVISRKSEGLLGLINNHEQNTMPSISKRGLVTS